MRVAGACRHCVPPELIDVSMLSTCCIMCPHHKSVNEWLEYLHDKFPGDYLSLPSSVDCVPDTDGQEGFDVDPEWLFNVKEKNVPPHLLKLKR